ncbi:MAG TPA: hypothetical protein VFW28_16315 [Micropepsaceae bacterium]|nr:hypothetical protein [Micropepsaceae bacterium]
MIPLSAGPVYCEDMSAIPGVFPVEPMNTISNGVIVLFGLAGLYFVWKRSPRAYDLYALNLLTVFTGIGSGMWHGFRDGQWLFWEATSGLIFMFFFIFCWARRLWSIPGAVVFLGAFYAGFLLSRPWWGMFQRWVAIAPVVVIASLGLIAGTIRNSREAAAYGGVALASALIALFFRSIDLTVCSHIPFGTHFLWHSFLSGAGFIGVLGMLKMPQSRMFRHGPVEA